MSALFLSNMKLQFSNRRPEKEVCGGQGCEGLELIGFAAIMQHFQVPSRQRWRCQQGRVVPTAWRTLIGNVLIVDKHLIQFTGANRHNDNFVISGRPKGGTYQIHIKIDPSQVHHTNDVDVNRAERY